jgi:LysR family transcriptional regulator, nod-box dependent transcriptional activator
MRFNKLDLNQLVVLNALLSEQSVKKAADKIFLSPAATSCALARLREYFEDDLLMQIGKTMVLSPKAERLRQPVQDVLLQIQAITAINPAFDPGSSTRKITIEASDYVIDVFLTEVLKRVAELSPLMEFELREIGPHSHAELENGDIDILICADFFTVQDQPAEALFEDTWSCLAWAGNKTFDEELSLEQYLDSGHVVVQWGARGFRSAVQDTASSLGYDLRSEVIVPSFSVIPKLLVGTKRITTIQSRMAQQLISTEPLRIFPCPMPMQKLKESVQWHKHKEHDPAISWFRDILKQVATDLSSS